MTWLFVRFYLCVLIVLFLAWYIYGAVLRQRTDAHLARVIVEAHGGGARLVAQELDAALPENREQVWKRLRGRFDYPVDMIALTDLPSSLQRQIRSGEDVACFRLGKGHCVVAALSSGSELVRLGPFPDYDLEEIEQALGGWMRLTADKLDAAEPDERQAVLRELKKGFDFPVEIVSREDLPAWPKGRIARGEDIVFYPVTLHEIMDTLPFEERIDYYPGCYRLHRKFSPVPMDLRSTEQVFAKLEGLDIHRIGSPQCCFKPEGVSHMMENVRTQLMVHVCTGCYGQALAHRERTGGAEVLMLPELVERAVLPHPARTPLDRGVMKKGGLVTA